MEDIPDDPLKLMAQIAALCSDLGAHEQARTVFQHLALLRDNDPNALVAWAVAQSRSGDERAALATLELALAQDPAHDMARVMWAIHRHRSGDAVAREVLRAVLAGGQDPDALSLAASVQQELLDAKVPVARSARHRYSYVDAG